jgi:hypothetical protein
MYSPCNWIDTGFRLFVFFDDGLHVISLGCYLCDICPFPSSSKDTLHGSSYSASSDITPVTISRDIRSSMVLRPPYPISSLNSNEYSHLLRISGVHPKQCDLQLLFR